MHTALAASTAFSSTRMSCLTPHFARLRPYCLRLSQSAPPPGGIKTPTSGRECLHRFPPSRFCFLILILTRSLVQIPHTLSYTPTLFKFFILKRCCPSPKSSLSPPWPSARLPRPSRSSNATPASTPATRASPHAAIVAAGLCRRSSLVWKQTSTSSWMPSV